MDPDETAVGEVLLTIQPQTQFLIAVGSGSITDITRVNATRTGLPFVSVEPHLPWTATLPSSRRYCSGA